MTYELRAKKVRPEALRSIAHGTITGSYAAIGSAVANGNVDVLIIDNEMDVPVLVSFDGTTDHLRVGTGDSLTVDMKSNNLHVEQGMTIYIKEESAASSGNTFIMAIRG